MLSRRVYRMVVVLNMGSTLLILFWLRETSDLIICAVINGRGMLCVERSFLFIRETFFTRCATLCFSPKRRRTSDSENSMGDLWYFEWMASSKFSKD
ncbi:hypothetical protein TSAR_008170 [Trichomalopsis sarcophagae]|uniref:Uncharacterized protein n=1 Tax=Trichomalopsis sarcophagae TaxID=543379 RepID=A0A232F9G4_9HYME|nr:hypothetical protein TSAR_008170 [Trichomalopsis sarcophagae]